MTCDDARALAHDPSPKAREHLAACPPCADYASDIEVLWELAATAAEPCPERRKRWTSTAAAAALILTATTWAAWPREDGAKPAAQDIEEKVRDVARLEKERLAEFESRLAAVEKGFAELAGLTGKEAVDRAEALLTEFPGLKLVVLDVPDVEHRARVLKLKLLIRAGEARLKLLSEENDLERRAAAEIILNNQVREHARQLEEVIARGPRKGVELGGPSPSPRAVTLEKLRAIKITLDFTQSRMEDVAGYLREITGLNVVFRGAKEARAAQVTLKLSDVTMEAALDHLAAVSGFAWEVDRFGILNFTPR